MSGPSYRPNDDEDAVALLVAHRRQTTHRYPDGGTHERTTQAERLLQQYRACLAEIALAHIDNSWWTGLGAKANTALRDVAHFWEVRTRDEGSGQDLRVGEYDLARGDCPVVLVDVDGNRNCTVVGWTWASHAWEHGEHRVKRGSHSSYFPREALTPWGEA